MLFSPPYCILCKKQTNKEAGFYRLLFHLLLRPYYYEFDSNDWGTVQVLYLRAWLYKIEFWTVTAMLSQFWMRKVFYFTTFMSFNVAVFMLADVRITSYKMKTNQELLKYEEQLIFSYIVRAVQTIRVTGQCGNKGRAGISPSVNSKQKHIYLV